MKVTINGETFDYDADRRMMSEALWIEQAYGRRYVEWETERIAGEAKAMAVFCCFVWRQNGRDVPVADVLEGKVDFSLTEVYESLNAAFLEKQAAAEAAAGDPTSGASPRTEQGGTATTPAGTPGPSARSSTSARGRSAG